MADSILPQPALRAPMEFVQGGGGLNTTAGLNSNAKLISQAQLKVLSNGLTVRYVKPAIKDDIMNLRFIKGEQELFDKHQKIFGFYKLEGFDYATYRLSKHFF